MQMNCILMQYSSDFAYPTIIAMSVTIIEVTENIPLMMLSSVNHLISSCVMESLYSHSCKYNYIHTLVFDSPFIISEGTGDTVPGEPTYTCNKIIMMMYRV